MTTELVLECPQCGRTGSDLRLVREPPPRWPGSISYHFRCQCGAEFVHTVFQQATPALDSRRSNHNEKPR